jgi:hypothetical protein
VKGTYDLGVKGRKVEFDPWYDVLLGETTFEKVGRETYKWSLDATGQRGCKAVRMAVEEVEEDESVSFRLDWPEAA